jgi:hypothetical protein
LAKGEIDIVGVLDAFGGMPNEGHCPRSDLNHLANYGAAGHFLDKVGLLEYF